MCRLLHLVLVKGYSNCSLVTIYIVRMTTHCVVSSSLEYILANQTGVTQKDFWKNGGAEDIIILVIANIVGNSSNRFGQSHELYLPKSLESEVHDK